MNFKFLRKTLNFDFQDELCVQFHQHEKNGKLLDKKNIFLFEIQH